MSLASRTLSIVNYNTIINEGVVSDTADKIGSGLSDTFKAIKNKFTSPETAASHDKSMPFTTKQMPSSMNKRVEIPQKTDSSRPIGYSADVHAKPGLNVKDGVPMHGTPTATQSVASHAPSKEPGFFDKVKHTWNNITGDKKPTQTQVNSATHGGETATFGNQARKAAAVGDSKGALTASNYASHAGEHKPSGVGSNLSDIAHSVGKHFSDHAKEYAGGAALVGAGALAGHLLGRKKKSY